MRSLPALALALATLQPSLAHAVPREQRTQFVIVSMDTTPSGRRPIEGTDFHRILRATREGAGSTAQPGSFTVFISTGGLTLDPRTEVTPATRPHLGALPRNRPTMRYADDLAHLRGRVEGVRRMAELGIELGSHAVRHEHGRAWTRREWEDELRDHERILDLLELPRPLGFRAPFLEHNTDMYDVLRGRGYRYDVSRTGSDAWPARHPSAEVWLFEIPSVRVTGHPTPVLLFDDNVRRVLGGVARDRGLEPGPATDRFMDEAFLLAAREGFQRRYRGTRAPFLISGHGGFITPTVQLLREVCPLPHVRCASFSEAVRYLEAHPELAGARE